MVAERLCGGCLAGASAYGSTPTHVLHRSARLFLSMQAAKAKQPHKAVELFEAMSTSGVQVRRAATWPGRAV